MFKEGTRYCSYRRHQPKAFGNDKSLELMITFFAMAFAVLAAGYLVSVIPSDNQQPQQNVRYNYYATPPN